MESEVIVHTSLPPGVEGRVYNHLYLQIPYIIWNKKFKKDLKDNIYVKVCWWGEKTDGAIFYPSVLFESPCNNLPKSTAKYDVCSDHEKFTAYLKDMEKLHLKVSSTNSILGTTSIDNISLLTSNLQLSGLFPVISSSKKKIAELFVKITLEKVIEENMKLGKSMEATEEKSASLLLKRQHAIQGDQIENTQNNSDLIDALLEKAENLRQAMIISLLENKNLEHILENERRKFKEEEIKRSDLIENVLGIPQNINKSLQNVEDKIVGSVDLNDSPSSSVEPNVNELMESFDSVPDDAVINELFYSDANFGTLPQLHDNPHNTYSNSSSSKKAFMKSKSNKLVEKRQHETVSSHQLSPEMRLIIENIKLFKVRIKDMIFSLPKTTSNVTTENTLQSLLQRNKPRTFIVEFMSPFPVKVGLWDHKGHRRESTNLLTFISRKVKLRAVSFEQEVTIPLETTITADVMIEKELAFSAKVRLHDARKIIDLGNGSIKMKDCIAVDSTSLERCIPLRNNVQSTGMVNCTMYEVVHPTLRVEVSLVLSEFKLPVDKAVATSDDDMVVKDSGGITLIQSASEDGQPANKCDLILTEPVYCLLQITEGKGFGEKKWLHIVCRLFFSKNAVFRDILYNPDEPTICFSQIFPILLNKELLKQTENNVMIIEVWERLSLSDQMRLKGLCKLPLHCFYLVFKNAALAKSHLLSKYPIISTSGRTPVIHPVTGSCNGEFNILFALGTLQQIDNMLEESFQQGKSCKSSVNIIEPNKESSDKNLIISEAKSSERVPHILEVSVEELGGLKIARNMVWGEADCYVTYCLPTQENDEVKVHLYKTNSQLIMPDVKFKFTKQFVYFLDEKVDLEEFLLKEVGTESDEIVTKEKYPVKLWGNFYNPYQRTELLASTYISLTDLCGMIKKAKSVAPPEHHSFKVLFQSNFTNNCRLKVGYVKFSIAYWKQRDKEQESGTVETTSLDENISDPSIVQVSDKKNADNSFASKSDQYNRDMSTETDTIEMMTTDTLVKREDDHKNDDINIPERDNSVQSFSDRINSKAHLDNECLDTHFPAPTVSNKNDEVYSINKDFTFNAHVAVERALHLSRIPDKKSHDFAPSTYVTFNTDDQTEFTTNAVKETCDPVWNWHHDVTFSTAHPSVKNGVNLIFKVLCQRNDESNPEPSKDKVLGAAVVELTPLLHGLNKISGWYNVIDAGGKCQGQIKISVTPERNEIFQQIYCNCTIQPDRNKQNNTKSSLSISSQRTPDSVISSPASSLQKQLEELDVLHSYLVKRLAEFPVKNTLDDYLKLRNSQEHGLNVTNKQGTHKSNSREQSPTKSIYSLERNNYSASDNAKSCSIHFSPGKQPVFNTPLSPHKTIQYTTYIHSKCINSSSSLHSLHEDDGKCDYCDKLEVISSTVETIDLSMPLNEQVVSSTDLTKDDLTAENSSKSDERTGRDNKSNSFKNFAIAPSSTVEVSNTASSHSVVKNKEEDSGKESSGISFVESTDPV